MTAMTWDNENNIDEGKPFNFNFLLLGVIIVVVSIIAWISNSISNIVPSESYVIESYDNLTVEQIRIIETISQHAWARHGEMASAALDCLKRRGSTKSFKTFGFKDYSGKDIPTNLWMCLDIDGSWYSVATTAFEKIGQNKVARLITAYKVAVDNYQTVADYINALVLRWNAIPIDYSISAEQIIVKVK
jgi:hypothetical protein